VSLTGGRWRPGYKSGQSAVAGDPRRSSPRRWLADPGWPSDLDALPALVASLDRVEHTLGGEAGLEGGQDGRDAVTGHRTGEPDRLVDDGVLPVEDVPWRPPRVDVGVRGLAHEHRLVAAVSGPEDPEFVEALEREPQTARGPVDGDGVVVLVAPGHARGSGRPHGTLREVDRRRVRVVDGHGPRLLGTFDVSFLDERPKVAARAIDRAGARR